MRPAPRNPKLRAYMYMVFPGCVVYILVSMFLNMYAWWWRCGVDMIVILQLSHLLEQVYRLSWTRLFIFNVLGILVVICWTGCSLLYVGLHGLIDRFDAGPRLLTDLVCAHVCLNEFAHVLV